MRKQFFALASAAAIVSLTTFALAKTMNPSIVMAGHEKWMAGQGAMKGAQVAVLSGNPKAAGLYIVRLKVPAGSVFGPHYHNETENVTVISGTLWVGLGTKMNKAKMIALPAGSFVHVPGQLRHYALTKTATVIDLTGMGPETMMSVKP